MSDYGRKVCDLFATGRTCQSQEELKRTGLGKYSRKVKLPQQMFEGISRRRMQNDAVFVLLDLGYHLEQLENHAAGLSRCEFSVLERLSTQLLVQHIGNTMQDEPRAASKEGGAKSSVGGQITLQVLDEVFRIPSGTIEFGVNRVRFRQVH